MSKSSPNQKSTNPNDDPYQSPVESASDIQVAKAWGPFPAGETTSDERTWGMLAHLSPLVGSVVGFPVLGPLVVWLMKKEESGFVGAEAREALNFQITLLIAYLISGALMTVCIGFVLLPVVAVVGLVFSVLAGMEANKGNHYRYPYIYRFIT